jgi:RNA polymerase sigma-70 factor (ECF subfamily)
VRRRRLRPEEALRLSEPGTTTTGLEAEIADKTAEQAFEIMWNEEWQKNLVDAAMERVKTSINPEHYQIFYLHSVKNLNARRISELLRVSATKVYVVRHRVARLVKREVQALSQEAGSDGSKRTKKPVGSRLLI